MKNTDNTLTMASYGVGKFISEFLTGAYGIMVYYFYENEMHLNAFHVAAATVIYSVWNAVNDPLIGYITDRNCRLTRRFGRYTPWIVMGIILSAVSYVGIFTVPAWFRASSLRLFFWMVLLVCIFDTCYSLWEVNHQGVFPNKFRTVEERARTAVISTSIGIFGIALGAVLPPMFYRYGNPQSFIISALVIAGIALVGALLIRRGVRTDIRTEQIAETPENKPGFFKSLAYSLKYREFVALLVMFFLYQSACMCMTGSVNYVVNGVLGMSSSATTPIFAAMLLGTLISVLIWRKVAGHIRHNNQKLLIITCFEMAAVCAVMFFADTQLAYAVGMFAWGLGFGGYWTFMAPAMADVIDSVVVTQKRRDDGILMGVRAFFMRLSYTSQALVFWLCHKYTGYNPETEGLQAPLARIGIKLHISIIPSAFCVLASLIIMLLNTLTPEKVALNKTRLAELNL